MKHDSIIILVGCLLLLPALYIGHILDQDHQNAVAPKLVRINGVLRPQPDFTLYNPDADVIDSQPVSDGSMVTQK